VSVDAPADLLASIDLPGTSHSVPVARRVVAHLLTGWAAEPLREHAVLLLSELITNVVRHVGGPSVLRIDLRLSDPLLRVAVLDPSPTLPALPTRVRRAGTGSIWWPPWPIGGAANRTRTASGCGSNSGGAGGDRWSGQ